MPDLGPFKVPACTQSLTAQGLKPSEAFRKRFTCAKDNARTLLLAWALPPTQVIVHPYVTFQNEDRHL